MSCEVGNFSRFFRLSLSFPKLDHCENYWLYSFTVLLFSPPIFHFDQLFDALPASCCSFLLCFFWATVFELHYAPSLHTKSPIFLFWLYPMLITCCSRVLTQPVSVFLFFHSPRFFWFVLTETLLILCSLFPNFQYPIASSLLPCFCSPFCEFSVHHFYWNCVPYFAFLLPKPFALPLIARSVLPTFSPDSVLTMLFL